jgi:hypothetical protein
MSQESGTGPQPGAEQHRVPSQQEYREQTQDSRWVPLEEVQGSFQVQEIPPLSLLRDMKKYGVDGLIGGAGDDVDMGDVISGDGFDAFMENTVLPNIKNPAAYWTDPSVLLSRLSQAEADEIRANYDLEDMTDDEVAGLLNTYLDVGVFDLAELEPADLMAVITGMTGQDQDDLQEQMDDRFQG